MIKLSILEKPTKDEACCVFSSEDNLYYVHNCFEFPKEAITIISSALTGGTFSEYLKSMKGNYGTVCLMISPLHHAFPLPSFSGIGNALQETELNLATESLEIQFSPHLVCHYAYDFKTKQVILFDDLHTLNEKVNAAEKEGIQFLAADQDLIKKLRLPE